MSVILSKVRQPQRRKRILKRTRLMDMLHQNIHRKLNFVSAPAGYGKTTLLVDFAKDVDAVVCWYRISFEDTDLVSFYKYVIASFHQQFRDFGSNLDELFASAGGGVSPRLLASELVNEIHYRVDDFTVLIIDDYHMVDNISPIVDFIEALLEFLPENVRVIIGSRSVYGIPTATLYVREDVATIGAEELRFRADELKSLTSKHYRFKLSDNQANELVKNSEGWIVAILLAIRGMNTGSTLPKIKGATEQVFSFLAKEVIDNLPNTLKEFVLSLSILDEFGLDLCNHITGQKNSSEILKDIEGRNLFISRVETKTGVMYRFHQLFAEFLKTQLIILKPDKHIELHRSAASWYYKRQEWLLAIHHKLECEDLIEAAEWVNLVAEQFFTSGQHDVILNWYKLLILENGLVETAPNLILYHSKGLIDKGKFGEADKSLLVAEPIFFEKEQYTQLANLLVSRGLIKRFQNNYSEAIILSGQAQKIVDKYSENKYQWFQAERILGISECLSGNIETGLKHLNNAASEFRDLMNTSDGRIFSKHAHDLVMALSDIGFIWISEGNIFKAQIAFTEAMEISLQIRSNKGDFAVTGNNLAYLHYQMGHYGEAWRIYDQAIESAIANQMDRTQINILNGQGDLLRDIDDMDNAEKIYNQAIQLGRGGENEYFLGSTYLGLANLERLRKNYNVSLNLIREAARVRGDSLEGPIYRINNAFVYIAMGQIELSLGELSIVINELDKKSGGKQEQSIANILLGYCNYLTSDIKTGEFLLNYALKISAKLGYDQFLVIIGRQMTPYLEEIFRNKGSLQLESLLNRIQNFKPSLDNYRVVEVKKEKQKLRLEVHGFGNSRVLRNGEIIPNSLWKSSRSRALFFYILTHQNVRKEDIALEFWPDFSPAKISSNFHSTLWRVRKALGGSEVINFKDNVYCLHPDVSVWYDVSEFEQLVAQANTQNISDSERTNLWRSAIDLYQGEYLNDLFMDWIGLQHIFIQKKYLSLLMNLATREFDQRNYSEVLELCSKAIKIDPFEEKFQLLLMKSLTKTGAQTKAKLKYKIFRDQLRDEIGVKPSQEIVDYFNKLE